MWYYREIWHREITITAWVQSKVTGNHVSNVIPYFLNDPIKSTVKLFFCTQYVKYACKHTHTHTDARQRAAVEKKTVSLSKHVHLFHKMVMGKEEKEEKEEEGRKKKKESSAADSSHSLQALSPWRQHKDILFCFASFPILSKRMRTENERKENTEKKEKKSSRAPTEVNKFLVRSEGLVTDLTATNCFIWEHYTVKKQHNPQHWSAFTNFLFQCLLNKHNFFLQYVELEMCIKVLHNGTRWNLRAQLNWMARTLKVISQDSMLGLTSLRRNNTNSQLFTSGLENGPAPKQATFSFIKDRGKLLPAYSHWNANSTHRLRSASITQNPLHQTHEVCFHRTRSFVLHFKAFVSN